MPLNSGLSMSVEYISDTVWFSFEVHSKPGFLARQQHEVAARKPHDPARNAQSHAASPFLGGEERDEDVLRRFGRNGGPVVAYLYPYFLLVVARGFDVYPSVCPVADGLNGVLQYVHDHLRHQVLVDRKSTRLNSRHANISYAVFCLK